MKYWLVLPALLYLFASCKKTEPVANSQAYDPETFSGFITTLSSTVALDAPPLASQCAEARFYQVPAKGFGGPNDVNVGHVSVNGRSLSNANTFAYRLVNPPPEMNLTRDTWIIGAGKE